MDRVHKVKRPGGTFSYGVVPLGADEHGDWAAAPVGSPWHAPHDAGVLDDPALFLAPHDGWWVAWWIGVGPTARLDIDICVPAVREGGDWRYIDLELDVLVLPDGTTTVLDEDELEQRCAEGWISPAEAAAAERAARDVQRDVAGQASWVTAGWRRIGSSPPAP